MSDLALLGLQFVTRGSEQANKALDDYSAKSDKAETSGDKLAASTKRTSAAMTQVQVSSEKSARAMGDAARQAEALAVAEARAAAAARAAANSNDAIAKSASSAGSAVASLTRDLMNGGDAMGALGRNGLGVIRVLPALATGTLAFTAALVAMWDASERARESQKRLEALASGIGAAAGLSAKAIEDAARTGAEASRISISAARQQATEYAKTGQIGAEVLNGLMGLTQRYADATGQDAAGAVKDLGAAFADPTQGATELAMSLGILNGVQLEHIVQLEREGQHLAAQRELLAALDGSLDGTSVHVRGLAGAWLVVRNAALDAFDAMKKAVTGGTINDQLSAAQKRLAQVREVGGPAAQPLIARETKLIAELTTQMNALAAARTRAANNRASVEATASINAALPKETALTKIRAEQVKIRNAMNAGLVDAAKAQRALNALDEDARKLNAAKGGAKARSGRTHAPAAVRDTTDERTAQMAAMLAQAKADELQAQLGLTRDIAQRAAIEKQIIAAQVASKQAQVDRQIANIADDKGLSDAKKAELTKQLEAVKLINARVGSLQTQKVDEDLRIQQTRDAAAIQAEGIQNQIDLLASQRDVAKYGFQRRAIDREILAHQQQIERLKLQEIVATTESGSRERQIAEARLKVLDAIHANQRQAVNGTPEDAFNDITRALQDAARAFEAQDWNKLVNSLAEAFGTLRDVFTRTGATLQEKIGAVAGVGAMLGQAIGGKAGGALSGAASGAMAGATLGSIIPGIGTAIGAAIGTVVGGLGGLFGAGKQEKEAREAAERARREAELARALNIANAKREQEITLLELQGKAEEALKLKRETALVAMDATLHATQLQIWALEDAAEAAAKAAAVAEERSSLEIRLMKATGDAVGVLTAERAKERAGLDAANRAYFDYVVAQEDAATAVTDARDALSAAYERESAALQQTIDKFRGFSDSLRRFRGQLYSGPAAMLSPEEQYKAARAAFDQTSAAAAGGNEDAIRDLESVSQAYLDASKDYYASSKEYFADLERVRAAVTATQSYAAAQVSNGEAQLAALNASVSGILTVNASVLSVRDALAAYQSAVMAQNELAKTPAPMAPTSPASNDNSLTPRTPDWNAYLARYSDVAAEYARLSGSEKGKKALADIGVSSATAFAQWHYGRYGMAAGWTPFATGGIIDRPITLGESGLGGEAGPEGILPLANVGGEMGVKASLPDTGAIVAVLETIVDQQSKIIAELKADKTQRGAVAVKTNEALEDVAESLDRVNRTLRAA